jgi:hypothetical protein
MEASDGITLRTLRASDGQRLSRIDERITGRNRSLWYERKLERALRDSDMNVSLGAEVEGVLVGAVLGSVQYGEFGIPEPVAVLDRLTDDSHGVFQFSALQLKAGRADTRAPPAHFCLHQLDQLHELGHGIHAQ